MDLDLGSDSLLWDKIFKGDYLAGLNQVLPLRPTWTASDSRNHITLGTVYMCLRDYEHAAKEFEIANMLEAAYNPNNDIFVVGNDEGAGKWLNGLREEGAGIWCAVVQSLYDGTKKMSDFSGGCGSCLLLWFAGMELKNPEMIKLAKKQLKKISRRKSFGNWPGPIAKTLMENLNWESLFRSYLAENSLNLKVGEVPENYLQRRELSQLFFYWALYERYNNRPEECAKLMCASSFQQTILETEWFLARHYCELGFAISDSHKSLR